MTRVRTMEKAEMKAAVIKGQEIIIMSLTRILVKKSQAKISRLDEVLNILKTNFNKNKILLR